MTHLACGKDTGKCALDEDRWAGDKGDQLIPVTDEARASEGP